MKIPMKNRMTDEELEDKIWNVCSVEMPSKSKIWGKVGGSRNKCFDKINEMVQTSQLKEIPEGNKIMYVRIDSIKKAEFESTFKFQVKMLTDSRVVIKKLKKPLFQKIGIYKTTEWFSGLRKSIQVIDKKGEFKPKTEKIKAGFENMETYSNTLLLFITKTHLQRSLRLITKPEAERRIKKCENTLEEHFQKLQNENPRDSNAIRQYFKHKRFEMRDFRIS